MTSIRRRVALAAVLALGLLCGACGKDDGPPPPISVVFVPRVGETALPGVERPVSVRVLDAGQNGIVGVSVDFTPVLGSGRVAPATAVTDDAGIASTIWTLGPESGASQTLEARVIGADPAVLVVEVAPLAFHATNLRAHAFQEGPCASDVQVIPIPGPACSKLPSELKAEIRGTIAHSAFGSAAATLRCANLEVPLSPLLRGESTVVTLLWFNGTSATVFIDGTLAGTASTVIHPDVSAGRVHMTATGCGADNFHFGDVSIAEISLWENQTP